MPGSQTTTVVVGNIVTREPLCEQIEVECWPVQASGAGAPTGTRVAGPLFSGLVPTGGVFIQTNLIFFTGLSVGTQYSFRSRVTLQGGGSPSSWSVWATETAGDTTAPSTTYLTSAVLTSAGATLFITPSGSPTDHDHFELYHSSASGSPPASAQPTVTPFSTNGPFFLTVNPTATIYVSIRDVDTSGNRQAWSQLGGFTSGSVDYASDGAIFRRPMIRESAPVTMNPDFEQGGAGVPGDVQSGWLDWITFAGGSFSYDTGTVYAGTRSVKVHGIATHYQALANRAKFAVTPGDKIFVRGAYRTSATTVKAYARVTFFDKDGAFVGGSYIVNGADSSGAWTLATGSAVAPAGTVYGQWEVGYHVNSTTDGDCWFDALFTRKVASLDDEVLDGATYVRTTPNERDGGGRGYNALTASYNLATGRKVGGDSGLLSERIPEVIVSVSGAGYVKSQRISGSGSGVQSTVELVGAITSVGTGWHGLGTFIYILGLDVTSITFDVASSDLNDLDPAKNQVRETTGNNLGIDFAGAATPTYQRAGNGPITVSNPPVGGTLVTFYVKTKNGVSGDYVNATCSQKTLGAITKGDQLT